ncbi:ABC transporter permease [Kaistia geumhonensis]|uniref:Simple sugar transport system permease protein n=1 Tax=Kaistia geumhonensis TaxID=410839 RepID=A0ABU0M2I6_9HYPH|nr:ABC transporter permease [Kaistia geumhonensis]MCX5479606.1 ABC transporter permease [Kaistia geumhonensis]MDQ0515171.1 simple sugar transport system permease protein [Kaistia geumhonensis]
MATTALLAAILEQTAPILLAALAAMITLRANILNVAVEGMMLVGAFVAIAVGAATDSAPLALLAALVASVLMSQLLALMTLGFSADFIVAGLGINLLAAGGSLFALEWFYQSPGGLRPLAFPDIWHVPAGSLSFLPVIGPALEGQSIIVLAAFLAVPLLAVFLYRTPLGAYLRAAGEDEHAARSAGIDVARMKALSLAISGLLAGLAGAQLSMDKLHFFLPDMTSGRGFIGLAATLFGGGQPWITAAASLLFGFFGALGDRLQAFSIPSQFVLMLPYLAAIIGLAVARWRTHLRSRPAKLNTRRG